MRRFALPAALLLACAPATAWAKVTCTVSATPVSFGSSIDPFGSTLTSTGTVTVACTKGSTSATFTIALSAGKSSSFSQRYMEDSSSNKLNYNLYTTSALTAIWGDGTGGSSTVTGHNEKATTNYTVYGRLPLPQGVAANAYSDAITVTVTY
jgi:spore coat protein U-like protein